ncbi:MAG TPA: zinc ribbon domain-containing protein [Gemmatimonadales bacterium]
MTDLERFFERLVRNLAAIDLQRVKQPVPVLDIKASVMPYRTNRRSLGLESSEEYEELLVRLVSQEGGLVSTAPPDVAEWCARQMASLTPDLSGIPGQAAATITVNPQALARVLGSSAAASVAASSDNPGSVSFGPEKCPHCEATLPDNRAVNFCPTCGRSVTLIPCDSCGADLEPGWRFCTNCGQEVSEAGAAPT